MAGLIELNTAMKKLMYNVQKTEPFSASFFWLVVAIL